MKYGHKIYYQTEHDEVFKANKKAIKIDDNYMYTIKNPIYKVFSWLSYYFFAVPFSFVYCKIINKIKFHNKKILNKYKKGGYFIYSNHTAEFFDGLCPGLICFPQKVHIIVNPVNISMPIIGKFTKMWGAIPIPEGLNATKNFYEKIESTLNKNQPILIYPEAHLWPYYTKIRNFSNTSFRYPIKYNKPVFTFTTVYKKRKTNKRPKVEIYVDGPFYPNKNMNNKESQQNLRNVVYSKLCEYANLSDYKFIEYIEREKLND